MRYPNFTFESRYDGIVAGIDEAGRGPWAGPVVAAVVILNKKKLPRGVNDSKQLTRDEREALYDTIVTTSAVGVGMCSPEEIDALNILEASMQAMCRAFAMLTHPPCMALVDGNRLPKLPCKMQALVDGDAKSTSIAAASVIAKVTRDRLMVELAREHPHYGWERNAGYGTKFHQNALAEHGVTPHHRKSFAPIRRLLEAAAA